MNPATTVVSAKGADVAPVTMDGEDEKAVDVGPTTITVRVRDSGAFQEGSFRVVNIGDKGNGIRARIGRLKGETSTTIQAYMFDKEKWTTERAKKWVAAHKKVLIVFVPEEKEDDEDKDEDEELGNLLQTIQIELAQLDIMNMMSEGAGPTESPTSS